MNCEFIILILFLISTFVWASDVILTPGPVSCKYKKKDVNVDYDVDSDVIISCDSSLCTVNGDGVNVSAGLVNITDAGTYILRGIFEGQVVIDSTEDEHIQLVLDNTSVFSQNGPAIYGISADKITLTVIGNNTLTDSQIYNDNVEKKPDACLFTNSDLSINGSGTLNVMGRFNHAIRCKKDLKFIDATINVLNALGNGIRSKNSICIKDTDISINSIDTGIEVTRSDSPLKGFIVIDNGDISIKTGKDGIHARSHLTINDGCIDIKESLEGMEAQMIDILGGEIHINAINDGINASKMGKDSSSNDENIYLNIVGGKTYVNANGDDCDGLDSNGVLYIGGEAEVYASIKGGDIYGERAALESVISNSIVGGATVIATSSSSDNNNNNINFQVGGVIYQPYIYTAISDQVAGTQIIIKDGNNQIIATCTPEVSFHKIFVTSPKLIFGKTYTIVVDKTEVQTVFASEGHSGSINSPSVSSPPDRYVSFEEDVLLDKEYDVDDDVVNDDIINTDNNNNSSNKTTLEAQFIQDIEEEIDDYYNSTNGSSSNSSSSDKNNNGTTNSSSINNNNDNNSISNNNGNEQNDDDNISLPKYFHFDQTKENPYEVKDADSESTQKGNNDKINNTIKNLFSDIANIVNDDSDNLTYDDYINNNDVDGSNTNDTTSTTKSSSVDTTNEQNDDYNISLPKHFHFDIMRKNDTSGNTQYKWRKQE
jgi:hypothetical protein